MKLLKVIRFCLFISVSLSICQPACATPTIYGFENITNNNATDAAIGESQLFVDVTQPVAGYVLFTFTNTGPAACSITDVYLMIVFSELWRPLTIPVPVSLFHSMPLHTTCRWEMPSARLLIPVQVFLPTPTRRCSLM